MLHRTLTKRRELVVFVAIVLTAIFFRFYQLNSFPPGLYPDEAMNGNNALEALSTGNFKVFYPENNGREGLFINIQALSVEVFGNHPWSLRLVSAVMGILTVIGLYLLTKEMFEWRIAAVSGFLMAISFWHVNFSRIGFRAIMLPFVLVFGFYFFWKGIKNLRLSDFIPAGIFFGLGFHTYIPYRVAPLIVLILSLVYWWNVRKDIALSKYNEVKTKFFKGFAVMIISAIIITLPIGLYLAANPEQFNSRSGQALSVFSQDNPLQELVLSTVKTLGMFTFTGDFNQRHNIAGQPMLPWPIGIFFIMGIFHEIIHWFKRKHGHFSTTHTFILSWFFVMLLAGFLSTEAPHALRAIGAIPVVMILTAKGLWWSFEKIKILYTQAYPYKTRYELHTFIGAVMILFVVSFGFLEFNRYFKVWGPDQETAGAFNKNYTKVAEKVNAMPNQIKKYILVNAEGTLVNGVPMPSQTVMFLTDTYTAEKQKAKNIFYLTLEQYRSGQYDKGGIVIPLENK